MGIGKRGFFGIAFAALGAVLATKAVAGPPPAPPPTISGYVDYAYSFGISGVFNNSTTDFHDVGSASGTTGMVCADGTANIWNTTVRYAGEFGGFRIAAAGSLCQGFGTASEQVGGFDGRTTLGTFLSAGGRIIAPMNFNGFRIMPSAGAGIGYGNVKVEAAPFERSRDWRSGLYVEVGAAMPLSNWGTGVTQGVDASATELYVNFKRWDAGNQTLDGGARTDTVFNMYVVGARIRF
jgi:hypothetical protein